MSISYSIPLSYQLDIIAKNIKPNKPYKKYILDGMETIGVYNDEAFDIVFRNNSWQSVQIKTSIDGVGFHSDQNKIPVATSQSITVNTHDSLKDSLLKAAFLIPEKGFVDYKLRDTFKHGIISIDVYLEQLDYTTVFDSYNNPYGGTYTTRPIWINTTPYTTPYTTPSYYTYTVGTGGSGSNIFTNGTGGSGSNISTNISNSSATFPTSASAGTTYTIIFNNTDMTAANSAPKSYGSGESVNDGYKAPPTIPSSTFSQTLNIRYMYWDQLLPMIYDGVAIPSDNYEDLLYSTQHKTKYERICQ